MGQAASYGCGSECKDFFVDDDDAEWPNSKLGFNISTDEESVEARTIQHCLTARRQTFGGRVLLVDGARAEVVPRHVVHSLPSRRPPGGGCGGERQPSAAAPQAEQPRLDVGAVAAAEDPLFEPRGGAERSLPLPPAGGDSVGDHPFEPRQGAERQPSPLPPAGGDSVGDQPLEPRRGAERQPSSQLGDKTSLQEPLFEGGGPELAVTPEEQALASSPRHSSRQASPAGNSDAQQEQAVLHWGGPEESAAERRSLPQPAALAGWLAAAARRAVPGAVCQDSEFEVIIDRQGDESLGIGVDYLDNESTLLVSAVRDGLVQKWNEDNPEFVVHPGSHIVEVNGLRGDALQLADECRKCQLLVMIVRPQEHPSDLVAYCQWLRAPLRWCAGGPEAPPDAEERGWQPAWWPRCLEAPEWPEAEQEEPEEAPAKEPWDEPRTGWLALMLHVLNCGQPPAGVT